MIEIIRGSGTTPSEKYLAKLADKTFLNLWSYPNLHIDKKEGKRGTGKELCDLLVVCGDDILIFSDKSIEWPLVDDLNLAWSRWYRRAIKHSVAQIRGAERWLTEFPERVFLDAACTQPLPIELPPLERRRTHGIIVALGASQACAKYFNGDSGTFVILPRLKGANHTDSSADGYLPFAIGDVGPDGSFIHVFDDKALDLVMTELDTVSDFTRYLIKREGAIRSDRLIFAPGEEDLLAVYLQSGEPDGGHDFVKPRGPIQKQAAPIIGLLVRFMPFLARYLLPHELPKEDARFGIDAGMYQELIGRPEYREKKRADRISHVWDRLIEEFTKNILAGTSVTPFGEALDVKAAEQALRSMALESRVYRRMMAEALVTAMRRAEERKAGRFCRVVLPGPDSADRGVAYVFLIMAYPTHLNLADGYEQYRMARINTLQAYCLNVFSKNRHLKRLVGIAVDASPEMTGRQGGSEDILALEISEWTERLEQQARDLTEQFDIMQSNRLELSEISIQEYPTPRQDTLKREPSRRQRRALEKARRKALWKRR